MKKFFALSVMFLLAVSLTACNCNEKESDKTCDSKQCENTLVEKTPEHTN